MRKAKNSRSKLRKKEIEQLLEEMTSKLNSVIAEKQEGEQLLAEITLKLDNVTAELERSRLEKNADKTRQNIEALSKACISALEKMKATGSHWKIPANIFDKINHLENDIENKTTYLLSNLDQLRSWSGDVNISALSINASTIEKEAVAFFSNVRVEIENIEEELLHFIVEDEKLIFEEISQDMRDTVVELSKQLLELCDSMEEAAKSVKADKKIFHEIEEIRSLINTKESFLIQETFALKTVPEKSGANKQSKLEEVHRVDKEIKDSLEEAVGKIKLVKDKLQILSDAKKRRQKKSIQYPLFNFDIICLGYATTPSGSKQKNSF